MKPNLRREPAIAARRAAGGPAAIAAAVCIASALLAGCGPRASNVELGNERQVLHRGNGAEVRDLDPHTVNGVPEQNVLAALFEGLVAEDPKDLQPIPGVAERWEISIDGRTYTFHLRRAARWSNGDVLTAQDFLWSFQRILSPALAAEFSYLLWDVENAKEFNQGQLKEFDRVGFQAAGAHTLHVRLKAPVPHFLALLSHYACSPVHPPTVLKFGRMDERSTRWTLPGNLVANGPFTLDAWRLQDRIIVRRNPRYWDAGRVRLEAIHFYAAESLESEERAFRAGQYHVTYGLPAGKIRTYRDQRPEALRIDPVLGVVFYRLNTMRPPLNDARVRRALSLALERGALTQQITRGGEIPAQYFTPPGTGGFHARVRTAENLAEARRLLASAGFPQGQDLPEIELLLNDDQRNRLVAEALQEMWRKNLNLNVRLTSLETKVFQDRVRQRDFQIARSAWIGDYNDPSAFLNLLLSNSGNNRTGWTHPAYDALLDEAGRTLDQARRFELFDQAEAILGQEMPVIPLFFPTRAFLIQPSVQGWFPNLLDHHPYPDVFLQPR